MSYQPQQPSPGMGPVPGPPGAPMAPSQPYYAPMQTPLASSNPGAGGGGGGKTLTLIGAAALVVGLGAGVALYLMSGSAKEETVKKFARAPVGCSTTLEFDKSGTFTFYVETKGTLPNLGGDCAASGGSYERASSDLPAVTLTLTGPDGQQLGLGQSSAFSYDTGGYTGQAIEIVRVEWPGTYQLTVASDESDFAIAVGGDPEADSNTMQTTGLMVGAAGLLIGGLLLFLGKRKTSGGATPPSTPWQPGAAPVPGWQPQQPVTGYQQAPPGPPPIQPPAPPSGPGWGAPHP